MTEKHLVSRDVFVCLYIRYLVPELALFTDATDLSSINGTWKHMLAIVWVWMDLANQYDLRVMNSNASKDIVLAHCYYQILRFRRK